MTLHYLQWAKEISYPISRILQNAELIFILRETIERFITMSKVGKYTNHKKFGAMSFSEFVDFSGRVLSSVKFRSFLTISISDST